MILVRYTVKTGSNIIPAKARSTEITLPTAVTACMLHPAVVAVMQAYHKLSQKL